MLLGARGDAGPNPASASNYHIIMRQDIYEYLHELGWAYSHTTEDGRRIWARDIFVPDAQAVVTRYDEEERLLELAMEAKGA